MRSNTSFWKPFITLNTMMSAATPKAMPNMETPEMKEMNPTAIPVDTIAFELPGTPARYMLDIAQETGGKFSLVYKGKLTSGTAAERYTTMEWDDKE